MIKDPVTLEEKMENIKELVHQYVPDVEVGWSTGYRTLGYYQHLGGKNRKGLIRISKSFADGSSWDVIEQIVLHEIAHALTPFHGHDEAWKEKCVELGIAPERVLHGSVVTKDKQVKEIHFKPQPHRERKPEPDVYRYIEVCDKCGALTGHGSKKTKQPRPHKCGGTCHLLPNPLFNITDFDPDEIFAEMNEQLVSVLATDENVLGIANFEYIKGCVKQNHTYVICKKVPSEDERRAMYAEFEGLYEHAQINAGSDLHSAASDKLTVKSYQKETDVVFAVSDELLDYINDVLKCTTVPETDDYSIRNFFCLEKAEILFEKDDTCQKIKGLIQSCTKDVFRMICESELQSAITEEVLNSITNRKYAGINYITIRDTCVHIIRALYALNGRFCGKIDLDEGLKNTAGLEKKPEDFDAIFESVLKGRYEGAAYPDSLEKLLRLSIGINSLLGTD